MKNQGYAFFQNTTFDNIMGFLKNFEFLCHYTELQSKSNKP